ncbi:MAG: DNA polymerase III subunit delta [Ancrocorticia sp.]|jgi:DNA polymerase-3 subunit delta|nr:DNA polymerase III subunit delta [Ancrocorticia sp.]MCI2198222.1 DNA polymerase III subunit delta [Ancrocorticia sp.]
MARVARNRSAAAPGLRWDQLVPAPVILLTVKEPIIGEWAVDKLVKTLRSEDPATELTTLEASSYTAGTLATVTSPSLFGGRSMVVVRAAERMNDAFLTDALAYVSHPEPDVVVVIRHDGSARGRKLIDAIDAAGLQHATIPAVTRANDKADLVRSVCASRHRRIATAAIQGLVDALGNDVAELVAATQQLLDDTAGDITVEAVRTYYGGRIEASGFAVADATVAGQTGRAIALARHAAATGTGPVPIVAAIALKLRSMGVALALRGTSDTSDVRLAPWQIDRARRDLQGWSSEGLARAILAIAQADADVKGASRDPDFALERAIVRIANERRYTR